MFFSQFFSFTYLIYLFLCYRFRTIKRLKQFFIRTIEILVIIIVIIILLSCLGKRVCAAKSGVQKVLFRYQGPSLLG